MKISYILNFISWRAVAWAIFMMGMDQQPCFDRFHHVAMTLLGLIAIGAFQQAAPF